MDFELFIDKYKIKPSDDKSIYYKIKIRSKKYNTIYTFNEYIASITNIDIDKYEYTLKENFNGIEHLVFILFRKKEDAEAACDWIESIMLMNKLIS